MPSATRWKVVLPRSIPIERICDLICMTILPLAFCQHHHDSRWLTSGGPSHYPHYTQNGHTGDSECNAVVTTIGYNNRLCQMEHLRSLWCLSYWRIATESISLDA